MTTASVKVEVPAARKNRLIWLNALANATSGLVQLVVGSMTGSQTLTSDAVQDFGNSASYTARGLGNRWNLGENSERRLRIGTALGVLTLKGGFGGWQTAEAFAAPEKTGYLALAGAMAGAAIHGWQIWKTNKLRQGNNMEKDSWRQLVLADAPGAASVLAGTVGGLFLPMADAYGAAAGTAFGTYFSLESLLRARKKKKTV